MRGLITESRPGPDRSGGYIRGRGGVTLATSDIGSFLCSGSRRRLRTVTDMPATIIAHRRRMHDDSHWENRMRLTVLGCAGSFPGPESACSAYLVEADGFRLLLDFGSGLAVGAAALRRPARRGRDPAHPPALRPHLDAVPTWWSAGTPRRPVPAPAGVRAGRRAGPARRGVQPGRRRRRRRLHLLRPAAGQLSDRPVHRDGRPGQPSRRDVRRAAGARRPVALLLGGHRALRRAAAAGARRRPVPVRGQLPRRRGQPAGPAPHRPGGGRGRHQGRGGPAAADPPGAGLGQRGAHRRGGGRRVAGPIEVVRPGARYEI